MLAIERRNLILERLQLEKKVIVSELSEEFGVSEETIRRDLDKLDRDGLAIKQYGGAILNENSASDMPIEFRRKHNQDEKTLIGRLLADVIRDGDQLMMDSSTTAQAILSELTDRSNLTIITNSIEMLVNVPDNNGWEIISTGGRVVDEYMALVGSQAIRTIGDFRGHRVIFSCRGLDRTLGVMDSHEMFTSVKQAMIRSCREKILVVDSTKFDKAAFSRICDVEDLDMIVTGVKPDQEWISFFREKGVRCLYPGD